MPAPIADFPRMRAKVLRQPVDSECGIALVLALAFLFILSIVVFAAIDYSGSASRSAKVDQSRTTSYPLAEAGINDAISVLSNSANDPTNSALLGSAASPRVETFNTGTVSTYGVFNSSTYIWTITATSTVRNPTGAASLHHTIVAQVQVSNASAWDKIYSDDTTSCLLLDKVSIPSPFSVRGCISTKDSSSNVVLSGSPIEIGGNVLLHNGSSIGLSGSPVAKVDVGGTCTYGNGAAHTPCSAVDSVFATSISTTPTGLTLPTFNWSNWYANAAPGPMHPCTTSTGSVPQFDKDSTYNGNNPSQEITPEASNPPGTTGNSSYTCQVRDNQGNLLGELDWNNQTRVLTINGTVFFDGDAVFHDSAVHGQEYIVHVNGRGTIMASGGGHIEEVICAGGSGTTDCSGNMSSWDPSQNLLTYVTGGKDKAGSEDTKFHEDGSAFQGILYCVNQCTLNDRILSSGPIIAGTLSIGKNGPTFYTWPRLATLPAAEVSSGGPWTITLLSETG